MARGLGIVSLLAALAVGGYLFSAQWRSSGPTSPAASTAVEAAEQVAAGVNLQQAATAMEQFRAANGTYAGADLGGSGGVVLLRADASSYCLQAASGAAVLHLAGPGGAPAAGPC